METTEFQTGWVAGAITCLYSEPADSPLIKSLIAYDELSQEPETQVTQANLEKRP